MEKKYTLSDFYEINRRKNCFTCSVELIPDSVTKKFNEITDYLIANPDIIMEEEEVKTCGYTIVDSLQYLRKPESNPSYNVCGLFWGIR